METSEDQKRLLTKACAWCGHPLVDQGILQFSGFGFIKIRLKCFKCEKFNRVTFETKFFVKVTRIIPIFLVLIAGCSLYFLHKIENDMVAFNTTLVGWTLK